MNTESWIVIFCAGDFQASLSSLFTRIKRERNLKFHLVDVTPKVLVWTQGLLPGQRLWRCPEVWPKQGGQRSWWMIGDRRPDGHEEAEKPRVWIPSFLSWAFPSATWALDRAGNCYLKSRPCLQRPHSGERKAWAICWWVVTMGKGWGGH